MKDVSSVLSQQTPRLNIGIVVTLFIGLVSFLTWFICQQISPPNKLFSHYFQNMFWIHLIGNWCAFFIGYLYIARKTIERRFSIKLLAFILFVVLFVIFDNFIDSIFFMEIDVYETSHWLFISIANSVANVFYLLLGVIMRLVYDGIFQRNLSIALELSKLQAQVDLLKTQTTPHFLFNVLNALYSNANKEGAKSTAEGLLLLSELLRYSLYKDMDSQVSLEDEVTAINQYLSLEQLRFNHGLPLAFSTDIEDPKVKIPPMLLMTLVENAIKHGANDHQDEDIVISITHREQRILVMTSNVVSSKNNPLSVGGLGLTNLRQRLTMLFPEKHTFDAYEEDGVFHTKLEVFCL